MILTTLHIITMLLFAYLAISTVYLMCFAIAGRLSVRSSVLPTKRRNVIVLIPAYREDAIIIHTARSAVKHHYAGGTMRVVVIADSLRASTLAELQGAGVEVLTSNFELGSKARSLHAAVQMIAPSDNDFVVILDADNILEAGCLDKMNNAFNKGFKALQVHRTAKNTQTPIALLDAISEEINLNIFRRGAFNLGLSAAPMGSGMAFLNDLFIRIFSMEVMLTSMAEDREVENYLLQHGIRLAFIDDAFVYDEKVSTAKALKKQRVRWMEAQLNQLRYYWNTKKVKGQGSGQYYHTFFQTFLLPRVFYLLLTFLILATIAVSEFLNSNFLFPPHWAWLLLIFVYWLVLLISVPEKFMNRKTVYAIMSLPSAIVAMLGALLKLKKERKEFIHTAKSFVGDEQQ
jgi:cellulose synthase/poly-beta-1,6-N-acetylglucosamine synthase-like glycosyltransferase